jgi:hypothetical protein
MCKGRGDLTPTEIGGTTKETYRQDTARIQTGYRQDVAISYEERRKNMGERKCKDESSRELG